MKWRDWQLWAALVAAPLFWGGWFFYHHPSLRLDWPLVQPLLFVLLVVVYPLLEEIVFRGLLQPALAARLPQRRCGLSVANLLTSLLFAGLHLFYKSPFWALATFLPSLVFGHFRDRHASLASPILLHVWYNLGYFLLFPPV